MHKHGWKLVKISGIGTYHFAECEAEDVVYQLDYNLNKNDEYFQMFKDCGWEYLFDFAQYSYFRKPKSEMQGEEEIFCDEQSRYDMMTRVYKGRLIPLLVVFCALIIPQFILNLFVYHNYGIAVLYGMIFALYGTVFVSCMKKRNEFREHLGL
jgi:hypothetical protein